MANPRLTKKEIQNKKQIAYVMYMAFEDNKIIAETLDVTPKTIGDWAEAGHWKTKRSDGTITRDELVNKCLLSLNKILDKALEEGGDDKNLADDLAKMSKTIETLDKKNNIVYNIETFFGFNKYLLIRMQEDKALHPDLVKVINKLQNDYITQRMA
jgi:hypothetical protein